ncbi:collagen-like protein [Streptomyces sp. NPDC102405]|uniref:collagen-like protein n=1 Tax=Streptomyces sp. NPDC102405 TaxID=3366170 RepID=UPI003816B965
MTRAQIRAEERRWRRGDLLAVTAAIAVGTAFAWIVLSIQGMAHDLHDKDTDIAALSQQVRDLGGKPVAGPPGAAGKSIVGPRGPKGEKGDQGAPGSPGASGSPGATGKDGADGTNGQAGEPGSVGVTGPAGPAGPAGPQGEPGPAGAQGEKGDTGEQGPAGPTCPDGYSLQTPTYDPYAKVCREDGAPQPGDSNSPSPQSLALDPQRRQYV